jgi:hypothetical protein
VLRGAALCSLAAVGMCLAGCDSIFGGEHRSPAEIVGVSLPESLVAGDPVVVRVYTPVGDCTVQTFSKFAVVDDTTFTLAISRSSGTAGVGCPGYIRGDDFILPGALSRRFHIRLTGTDTLDVVVHGGTRPAAIVHHTFRLVGPHAELGIVELALLGCVSESCDTLAALMVGSEGASFAGPCALSGMQYRTAVGAGYLWEAQGTLYCAQPWQTVIRY